MNHEFHFRNKIPVGILGATGCVGQKFVELLSSHPWFEIAAVAASERSCGKRYKEAVKWLMPTPLPAEVGDMEVMPCEPNLPCSMVFSALEPTVAEKIETSFAQAGFAVVSNVRAHRLDPKVPLVIPGVNSDHLDLVKHQKYGKGCLVTNPNCAVIGLSMALKPLLDCYGLEAVNVVTLQALSGAGYPGVPSLDAMDNVIPHIPEEEKKLETEPLKVLGDRKDHTIKHADIKISAQCNRVPVSHGHTACVSIKLKSHAKIEEIKGLWKENSREEEFLNLPTAPSEPIHYFEEDFFPQPKLHRDLGKGMTLSLGRLRECSLLDYKFAFVFHNAVLGAAGCALLNAELLVKKGHIYW